MTDSIQPEGFFQYFPPSPHDRVAGFHITNYGWTKAEVGMPYPPWQHPAEFQFSTKNGRRLKEYQLVHITRGAGSFWSAQTGLIPIQAGTVFLLTPEIRHKYKPDPATGWSEQWFGFDGDVARRLMHHYFDVDQVVFELDSQTSLLKQFEKLLGIAQNQQPGFRRRMAIVAQEIILNLLLSREGDGNSDHEIELVCQQIAESYAQPLDFHALAKSIGLSYSNFRKRFKKHTGLAPKQYQMETKLQKAQQLLDNSNLKIQEIAHSCGFESPYYFSRYFKKATGLSPKAYRARSLQH